MEEENEDAWRERRVADLKKVKEIQQRYRNKTIDDEDMLHLFQKARAHAHLAEIADIDWAKFQAEIMARNIEIEELKRQLEERQ